MSAPGWGGVACRACARCAVCLAGRLGPGCGSCGGACCGVWVAGERPCGVRGLWVAGERPAPRHGGCACQSSGGGGGLWLLVLHAAWRHPWRSFFHVYTFTTSRSPSPSSLPAKLSRVNQSSLKGRRRRRARVRCASPSAQEDRGHMRHGDPDRH